MHAVYLACLFGGLVATVLFAALGALGGAGHGASHAHLGHTPGHGAHATATGHGGAHGSPGSAHGGLAVRDVLGWTLSWLNPLALAAAALWFGGAGLVGESLLAPVVLGLALPVAAVAAVLGALLVRALLAALVRSSTPPLHDSAVGALGTINAPIRADGAGEVLFTLEGLARSAPARTLDGQPMARGTRVVIVRRERGMAWVAPLDPLDSLAPPVAGSGDLSPPP